MTFPFILPGWKAEKTQTGFLMISPKMATDRRRAGKRRLIRREGFASRISKKTQPHDPEGGAIRPPNLQNCVKTKIKKPPMDIVENRKPKLMRVSFKVAKKASSDGATNKQCLIDDEKDTKTTITKLPTDLVDIPKGQYRWCYECAVPIG